MPRLIHRVPAYRLHKPSGHAIFSLNGTIHYLGAYGSPESEKEYDRLVAEWLARGRSQPAASAEPGKPETTLAELIGTFWRHAKMHYRGTDGKPTQVLENVREALKRLYGHVLARSFGPLALRALRDKILAHQGLFEAYGTDSSSPNPS
jgi:hypothetical protein